MAMSSMLYALLSKMFSQVLQFRETGDGGNQFCPRVLLLWRISREFLRVDALLFNADLPLSDQIVEFLSVQCLGGCHVEYSSKSGRDG